jgi:hypothetical protein
VSVWCNSRGGSAGGRGRGFESHPERVARDFCSKNCATCDFDGDGRALDGGVPPNKNLFLLLIFGFFREFFAQTVR